MAVDPEEVERAEQALATVREEWMNRHGVTSIEIARRRESNQPTDDVCIRITVEKLLAPEDVTPGELFPSELGGTSVQVVEGGPPRLE